MRDDLSGLRALLSVARKKSFTAAAAELRVTPSAVSQTVRALEDRVGVRLLARTTRNVGLTEVGAQVVVLGSTAYLTSKGKPTHPRDLHAHDCINLRKITGGTVDRWRFVEDGKDVEIAVHGHLVTDSGALLVDAAVDGLGLAYVFESMVRELLADKRLVRVLDAYCPECPGYFLY